MIGNDLIAIENAFSNSRLHNLRFRKKVFTTSEEKVIDAAENRELAFWILWSMKEAAYKAHQRLLNLEPKLNPFAFNCVPNQNFSEGRVVVGSDNYFTKTFISKNHIHSIATSKKEVGFLQNYYPVNANYKSLFSEYISEKLKLTESMDVIKTEFGIPCFQIKNSVEKFALSISHDGNYAALVFPLIKC